MVLPIAIPQVWVNGQANAQKCLLALAEQSGPQFELGSQNGWGLRGDNKCGLEEYQEGC